MARLDKLYMGTNTKMTKTKKDTEAFVSKLSSLTADISRDEMELFVIPSYTTLSNARQIVDSSQVMLGAQNMCWEEQGQFTGEISPLMLEEVGVDLVMIGHSERRHVFGEQDAVENLKVLSAIEHGFTVLLCIGETEEQKENGISDEILRVQLKCGLKGVTKDMAKRLWIAYEPVWAIGVGGKPATAEYADKKHRVIKECLGELFGEEAGGDIPVLYGGSVNNQNAVEIIKKDHIDGLFMGRSAWDAENFNEIIKSVMPLFKQRKQQQYRYKKATLVFRKKAKKGSITMKDIVIGCDNAAVDYKNVIIRHLGSFGVNVENVGCDSADDPTYYPLVAKRVCDKIIESGYSKRGILICGTGIGMAMTANKFKGIRAAVCHDTFSTERSVLSNDGNVMCMGERVIGKELAKKLVSEWIRLEFVDGGSTPKVEAICTIEQDNFK